ncbi:hypothetical protein [Streptomyces sp. ISL-96]|uniref:hypothetical protein n=1 Tax=Streptomyces sp. ISL-96 TaxID=2819191 RepID=UPI0020363A26|nr:hypothetical protein [Streptomyces sp. ISL-96]
MTTPDFRPTHVVPQSGLPAWEAPDMSRPTEPLDPLLPVQLISRRGDWGQILCANGWSAWVDGRLLVSVPQEPPVAGQPGARTADPRPLLARVEESLSQYRRAAEDLTAGRTDGEGFRRRTRGLRVGLVVEGESVWLYDAEHERWVYCDGTHLITYATSSTPGNSNAPPREPTQVADRPPTAPPEPTVAAPDPTQVVTPAAPDASRPPPPEPTRVVDADPNGPPRSGAPAPPEPTRVVGTDPDGPPRSGAPAPPEPTRVVGDGAARSDEVRGDGARGGEPTRVVEPGDRAAPHPPTRPGDG